MKKLKNTESAQLWSHLKSVFKNPLQGSDRPATMADLAGMKYLEMFIKESHRSLGKFPR